MADHQNDDSSSQDTNPPADHDYSTPKLTEPDNSNIPETEVSEDNRPAVSPSLAEAQVAVEANKPPSQPTGINPNQKNFDQRQTSSAPPKVTLEQQLIKAKRDLESMVIRYAKSESENLQNKAKSEELDRKLKRAIKDNDSLANRIKILTNDKNSLKDTLNSKMAQLSVLEQKNFLLTNTQTVELKELEIEVKLLRKTNEELLQSIETYKSKEGELLDFSERLSMKQVLLQSELDKALESAPDSAKQCEHLIKENGNLNERLQKLQEQSAQFIQDLESERKLNETLRNEKLQLEIKSNRNKEELENEMKVMRRKHQMATKELLKQLRYLQVALEKTNTQNGNKMII